ncbi:8360_t:CDS:2, partial [Cetraspora pellucida]
NGKKKNKEEYFKSIVISTFESGICHGYITNCKGDTMFNREMRYCTGRCLVSIHDNIPNKDPYCPNMVVRMKFEEIECPKTLPNPCINTTAED